MRGAMPGSDYDVERVEYLQSRVDAQANNTGRTTFAIRFRGSPLELVKIRVEIGFPRFRLANGRTRRKQEQYLADNPELPRDLFADGASDAAQQAQQTILWEMGQEANLETLLESEGQRDPLVLTYDGYVINGNRRLAILREIENITHVDAVVLPADADAKDISALEMNLQMAEDGKAEYNWLDSLLTVEANISEVGFTEEEVAREMGCYVKTIQLLRHELDLVNRYLEERGYPDEHFRVEGDKQAFETLAKAHRDAEDPAKQANLRTLGFNIIANPAPGSSVHRQIEAMVKNLDTTVTIVARQHAEGIGETEVIQDDDLLFPLDDEYTPSPLVSLPISRESAEVVHEAIEAARGLNNEHERTHAAATQLKLAARILSVVEVNSTTAEIDVVRGQLGAISSACGRIQSQLDALAENS